MSTGRLIVIEGGDASGKATQTAVLKKRLEAAGQSVKTMSFPHYEGVVGSMIGSGLRGEHGDFMSLDAKVAAALFATDRLSFRQEILDWLSSGQVVILDRYTTASMLHQGSKIAEETKRQDLFEWIFALEHETFALPIPDLVIYLSVPAEIRARLQQGENKNLDTAELDLTHQKQVDLRSPGVFSLYPNIKVIECVKDGQLRSIENIAEEVYNLVQDLT